MLNILIDIGNTLCKIAVNQKGMLGKTVVCRDSDILKNISILQGTEKIHKILISSVKEMSDVFFEDLRKKSGQLIVVNGDTPLPVKNLYDTPETLGPDRIVAAVAAHNLFPDDDCLIFDFGTAITIDIVNKKGEFLGGNISLGMMSRFKSINQYTNKLPLLMPKDEIDCIGKDTEGAIESGVVLGIMFEVEGYIRKYPDCKIIFSGGDAEFFAKKMKSPIFVVCNLVLMGLSQIAEANAVD